MLLDLHNFITVDFIRKEVEKSCVVVSSFDEADAFAFNVSAGCMKNVIFETSNLKSYCFNKINELCDINIINCNSKIERFCESMINPGQITIFDNICKCRDVNILKIVLNKKGILVC